MSNKAEDVAMTAVEKRGWVPKLRFPEFQDAGEWEEKTLDDIAVFFKGKGVSKSDVDLQGETPCIRYGELYTIYDEVVRTVISKTKLPSSELFLSQKNDVLVPSSGETKIDIAKASCVLLDDVALGGDLNVLRPNENGIFLSYMLNGSCKTEIAKKAQGDTVVHLYAGQLKQLDVIVPKESEQQKIADCLSSIDELITLEAQKLDTLKTHKKGLMQQLFPTEGETLPKLRFPEFRDAGEWDECKLVEVSDFIKERVSLEQLTLVNYVSTENILPDYGGVTTASKLPPSGAATRFKKDDILISNIRPYLKKIWFSSKDGGASNDVVVIRSKTKVSNKYLACLLKSDEFISYVMKGAKGVKMPRGDISLMQEYPLALPSHPEQQKIADCLSSLDELVTLEAQKLDTLKAHKKGLMQQLFPALDEVQG